MDNTNDLQSPAPTAGTEPFVTVRYNHEDVALTRDDAIAYAQKGMYLDKLVNRGAAAAPNQGEVDAEDAAGENTADTAVPADQDTPPWDEGEPPRHGGSPATTPAAGESPYTGLGDGVEEFLEKYPNISAEDIPDSVLQEYARGVPLDMAYEQHSRLAEIATLKDRIAILEGQLAVQNANAVNSQSAAVPTAAGGSASSAEFFTREELNNLSGKNLENNLDKALRSMVYWSSH